MLKKQLIWKNRMKKTRTNLLNQQRKKVKGPTFIEKRVRRFSLEKEIINHQTRIEENKKQIEQMKFLISKSLLHIKASEEKIKEYQSEINELMLKDTLIDKNNI
jgi:hypothetical protein